MTRQFAPIVGLSQSPVPDSLLLDVTACGQLFGGESALAEQLVHRLTKHHFDVRATISDSVASAWAFAHVSGHPLSSAPDDVTQRGRVQLTHEWAAPVIIIPPGQSKTYLSKFPVAAARLPTDDVNVLAQLGILTVGQMLSLPVDDLPSRLSDLAITRFRQIEEIDAELITAIPEANPISAHWSAEFPATSHEEILVIMKQLTFEIAEQLDRRNVGANRIDCKLTQEDKAVIPLKVEAVRPVQDSSALFDLLKIRMERLSVVEPLASIKMTAAVSPMPVSRQRDLFNTDAHIRPGEELAAVVNRLSNKLGADAVLKVEKQPSPVPEKAVLLSSVIQRDENRSATGQTLDGLVSPIDPPTTTAPTQLRPLRLHATPEKVVMKEVLQPGAKFTWRGQIHEVAAIAGPERIQTDWWYEHPVHRDYYRVTLQSGTLLWIYQDLSNAAKAEFFVHGVFD